MLGHARQAFGTATGSIDQARALCAHNAATTLQTAAGVLGGLVWAIDNPRAGILEPDEMDYREVMAVALHYLGDMVGVSAIGTPSPITILFAEDVAVDPWRFEPSWSIDLQAGAVPGLSRRLAGRLRAVGGPRGQNPTSDIASSPGDSLTPGPRAG